MDRDEKGRFIKGFKHSDDTLQKMKVNHPRFWLGKKRENISGVNHYNWKKEFTVREMYNQPGYMEIKIGENWVKRSHYVFITENKFGLTFIPPGWVVHHIDLNKTNDTIDNLIVLPNDVHTLLHWKLGTIRGEESVS